MRGKDYVPHRDADFLEWAKNLYAKVKDNYGVYQVPPPQVPLEKPLEDFEKAWAAYLEPNHGHVDTVRKKDTRSIAEKAVRVYCSAWLLHNPKITAEMRADLRLPQHDTIRTTHGEPPTRPEFAVEVLDIRRLKLIIRDLGSPAAAIPPEYSGAVVSWGFPGKLPAEPEELPKSDLATHAHYVLTFTEEERGKTVHIAIRWQNHKGQKGPWSEIAGAVVP